MPNDSPSVGLKLPLNSKPGIYQCIWSTWWPLVSCTMSSWWFWVIKIPMWNETAPKGWFFEEKNQQMILRWPNFFRKFGWIWRLVKDSEKNMNQRWLCWWFVPCESVLPWSSFWKFVGGIFVGNQQLTNFTLQKDPKGSERILCFSSPNGLLYVFFFRTCFPK